MAKKANLSIALGVDIEGLKKGFEDAIKVTQSAGKTTEQEAKKMADGIVAQLEKIGNQTTMRGAIRQMENLAGQMQSVGLEGSKAFGEVVKQTGRLKAEQSDLKDLIEASRPDAPFKAMSNAVAAGTQAFAGLQGAMTLLGGQNEELQKQMVKLQAVMALADAAKSIDMMGDSFTQMGTIIKSNVIPALGTLKGALMATGIGAAIVAIGLLIEHFNSMASAAEKAQQAADDAVNFADKVRKLDQMDAKIAINRAKARGASAKELYEIQKRFNQRYIDDLLDAEKKGANVYGKVFEARKQMALDESEFLLAEKERQKTAQDAATKSYLANLKKEEVAIRKVLDLEVQRQPAFRKKEVNTKNPLDVGKLPQGNPLPDQQIQDNEDAIRRRIDNIKALNDMANKAASDGLANLAEAMGSAIGSGKDFGQAVGESLITTLTGFLEQFGKILIAHGIALEAFKKSIETMNGGLAIVAGVAMIATAAAVKSTLKSTQKFASGGMVSSPTFAMVGDNLNASNNPEYILRRDQLSKIMRGNTGFAPQLIPIIDDRGISILVESGNRRRGR